MLFKKLYKLFIVDSCTKFNDCKVLIISSPGRRPAELMGWCSVRRPSVVRLSSVVRRPSVSQLFSLNDFFSKTTKLISTKFGRKHL